MSKAEKENRIHSFALEFLEKQQIVPNLYADQIIRGYKEGYHQAEKDNELTWVDMAEIVKIANLLEIEWLQSTPWDGIRDWGFYKEVLKRFKDLNK